MWGESFQCSKQILKKVYKSVEMIYYYCNRLIFHFSFLVAVIVVLLLSLRIETKLLSKVILFFGKCQGVAANFCSFSTFQLIVLHTQWLHFLIQGKSLKLFASRGLLGFKKIEYIRSVGIVIFRESQNAINTVISLYSKSIFFKNYRLESFHQSRSWKIHTFVGVLGSKNCQFQSWF